MLRERTLHHLLLAVARSLEDTAENSAHRELIRNSCESLKVTREHKGPYTVSFTNENGYVSKTVETSQFRFHERGDVPAQIQLRKDLPDARSYNWEQATDLWRNMLGVSLSKSKGLAPARADHNKAELSEVFYLALISVSLLLVDFYFDEYWFSCLILAWTIPLTQPKRPYLAIAICTIVWSMSISGLQNPLLGLAIIVISMHLEYLDKSRFAIFWPLLGCLFLTAMFPDQLKIIILFPIVEILVSLVQRNFPRVVIHFVTFLLIGSYILIRNSSLSSSMDSRAWILVIAALLLAVAVFPYSSESNLIRITAPLMLSLGAVYLDFEKLSVAIFLIVWTLRLVGFRKTDHSGPLAITQPGTSVTLRKRDSTS